MSTHEEVFEAYVINEDGSHTRIPHGFARSHGAARAAAYEGTSWRDRLSSFVSRTRNRGSARGGIGRKVAGCLLVAVGIPLLILPGPGMLAIALGASLLLTPGTASQTI